MPFFTAHHYKTQAGKNDVESASDDRSFHAHYLLALHVLGRDILNGVSFKDGEILGPESSTNAYLNFLFGGQDRMRLVKKFLETLRGSNYILANAVLYLMPPGTPQQPSKIKIGVGPKDYEIIAHKGWIQLGTGTASKKGDAQQKAAEEGIKTLKKMGYFKEPLEEYKLFCKN